MWTFPTGTSQTNSLMVGRPSLSSNKENKNKAYRPTMRPQWAVFWLFMVTMAPMMVVMLKGRGSGGYGVDGGSSRCGGGNNNRNDGGEVDGGCGGDGDGGSSDD